MRGAFPFGTGLARRLRLERWLFALALSACGGRAEFDAGEPTSYLGTWRIAKTVCSGQSFSSDFRFSFEFGVDTLTTHAQGPGCAIQTQSPLSVDDSKIVVDHSGTTISCDPPACNATVAAVF
ncbi:MAG TPA: hypothetical protein VGC79_00030, partial [Polyangiaceae bacterium]